MHITSMKNTDFAYAAGYIDGDGCFQIGNKKWGSHLVVVSIRKEPVMWFAERFDGSIRAIHPKTSNRSVSYHFRFTHKGLQNLPNISKYLVEKYWECNTFLDFRKATGEEFKYPLIEKMTYLKEKAGLIDHSIKEELTNMRNTIEPSEEDFAYLAGFIDAECSLDINKIMQKRGKHFYYRPQLQCNNTKYPFFRWASQRFGGQFHFLDKSHIRNCRNQMLWRISNLQIDPILKGIYPFLTSKKLICEKMIEMRSLTNSGEKRISPNHPNYNHWMTDHIVPKREEIYQQVRHLNSI